MEVSLPDADIGVIVGRFQVPDLHDGHTYLIDSVLGRHKKVLVLVGCTPSVLVTRYQPLDYHTRMLMLRDQYPNLSILPLYDMPDDHEWSRSIDTKVMEAFGDTGTVLLYGSRDGFIPFYHGRHESVELAPTRALSGTEIRKAVSDEVRVHSEFRRGVVYAAFGRHPVAYPTVDIAVVDFDKNRIALGRKKGDLPHKWRFPGGFVDPRKDDTFEATARRETREELSCEIGEPIALGSLKVDDWRYRKEHDNIITSIFIAPYMYGPLKAGDDLDAQEGAQWFDIDKLDREKLIPHHRPIFDKVLAYLKKESN